MTLTAVRGARIHERVWTAGTGAVLAVGLFAALRDPGVLPSIALFLSASVMGVVCMIAFMSMTTPTGTMVRMTALGGALAGGGVVTVVGLARVLGPASVWVILFLVVTWPGLRTMVRRIRRLPVPESRPATRKASKGSRASRASKDSSGDVLPAVPIEESPAFVVPDEMEDRDICLGWCSSFVALQRASTPESRLRVVQVRALYLDELERRHPAAFAAWMTAGARAAGDPGRFLSSPSRRTGQLPY